jgi:hypothetical protein
MARQQTPFIVTGPGVEGHPAETVNHGLSAATTFACRAKETCTYYVRDAKGDPCGYAVREDDGIVYVKGARS